MKNLVVAHDQRAVTTSLKISEVFEKEHKHVLDSIENLVAENSATKNMFEKSTYKNRGREYPCYYMNRDGFTLLVMGYTGSRALDFKLQYIDSFNNMEKYIYESVQRLPTTPMAALELMFKAHKETDKNVKEIDDRVIELEENVTLSPSEYGFIGTRVSKRVYEVIQERKLNYTQEQKSELFKSINGDIKKAAGVRTRANLRQKHYDLVYDLITDWQPSKATLIMISQLGIEYEKKN